MSFNVADAEVIAGALVAARQKPNTLAPLPARIPATADDAYLVQDAVLAKLGPAVGWKVGAGSPSATPTCAPILPGGLIELSDEAIAVPEHTAIEVELAVRFAQGFKTSTTAPTADDVYAAIGSVHVVMELCTCRFAEGPKAPPLASLADNGMNLGFVIGPAVSLDIRTWGNEHGSRQIARASVDGKAAVETTGGHTHQDLFKLIVWQVGHVVTRRGGLPAGAVIATGSWTGLHWLTAPAKAAGEFPGLGRMDITLARRS
jgi:2-keto-4-pentenoate hydratase